MAGLDPAVTKDWRRPKFYEHALTPTLKQAVAVQLNADPDEQTALFEELALMRVYAGRFVAMYAAAHETGNEAKILMAGEAMRDALESVAHMCEKAHRLREKQKDRFSIFDLNHVVEQIVALHHEVAADYQDRHQDHMQESDYREMAALFEEAVKAKLVMPNASATGTTLHPDETAALFDSKVPTVDEDDALNDALVDQMRAAGRSDMLKMETNLASSSELIAPE